MGNMVSRVSSVGHFETTPRSLEVPALPEGLSIDGATGWGFDPVSG